MFDIVTDIYFLTPTKNGKYIFKVFDNKYFNVVAFMLDKPCFDSLNSQLKNGDEVQTIHVKCFYNFKSIFGNLVSVSDEVTGETYYCVS